MSPEQSTAARRLLGWSQMRLALAAELPLLAVVSFENDLPTGGEVILAIQSTLETAGVEFIAENGGGVGVRLRKKV
jgi:hypothetical protein